MVECHAPNDKLDARRASSHIYVDQRASVPLLPTDYPRLINFDPHFALTAPLHPKATPSPSPPDHINPLNVSGSKLKQFSFLASYVPPANNFSGSASLDHSYTMPSQHWKIAKALFTSPNHWRGGYKVFEKNPRPPKREPTIDNATQTVDLTGEVRITHQNAVSHGGFSDIYRGVWDRSTGKVFHGGFSEELKEVEVAVKLLRVFTRRGIDHERARKRLNREVNVWKRLEHSNIAKFYGVSFQLGGRPALVMQWYGNGTAPSYIKDRPMVFRFTLVKEVCAGLTYLHTLDYPVIHGDLKGNNILVDDDGHAVLSDFGLSKVIDDLEGPTGNTTTTLAGSVRWQAPELLFDDEEEDEQEPPPPAGPTLASDVWSLGCTIYELLSGRLPYEHRLHDWRVIQDVMRGISPLRPEDTVIYQSEGLVKILKDCWTLVPADRPTVHVVESRMSALPLD